MKAAFKNDPKVKAKALERAEEHRLAGRIVQGHYGEYYVQEPGTVEFSGCAIGCLATPIKKAVIKTDACPDDLNEDKAYKKVKEAFGFSTELCRAIDDVFEASAPRSARDWPKQIIEAIPVGADISGKKIREIIESSSPLQRITSDPGPYHPHSLAAKARRDLVAAFA